MANEERLAVFIALVRSTATTTSGVAGFAIGEIGDPDDWGFVTVGELVEWLRAQPEGGE